MTDPSKVRVRFPPSPTGFCHVGTARMAIVNFLFARGCGGEIVFRSEDTDKERSKKEYEDDILDSLSWLGLSWDEFFRQSERTELYRAALRKLIDEKKAYVSEEPSNKDPSIMMRVIRLKNPGKKITFTDLIRGEISFDTTELGDFAIARSIDDPLYHFAVVFDDHDMDITHVIRGEEHISNTPRQILIQEALGFERPHYAHYPLHLAADRSKLSKRKGDVSVKSYREKGYVPEAMLNYIATLGWTPPSGKEILSLSEMLEEFDIKDLHKNGAVFDIEKLNWYNRHYLLSMRDDDFAAEVMRRVEETVRARGLDWDETIARKTIPLIRERIHVWEDLSDIVGAGEFDFFFKEPSPDPSVIPGKGSDAQAAREHLAAVHERLSEVSAGDFDLPDRIKSAVWNYANEKGRGAVLWPLRYALTGKEKSPDPFTVASIIGKETSLARVIAAIEAVQS